MLPMIKLNMKYKEENLFTETAKSLELKLCLWEIDIVFLTELF